MFETLNLTPSIFWLETLLTATKSNKRTGQTHAECKKIQQQRTKDPLFSAWCDRIPQDVTPVAFCCIQHG